MRMRRCIDLRLRRAMRYNLPALISSSVAESAGERPSPAGSNERITQSQWRRAMRENGVCHRLISLMPVSGPSRRSGIHSII